MDRIWIKDTVNNVDKTVEICGWVQVRRDHGKLIFLDVRDRSGILQVVFSKRDNEQLFEQAELLRSEYVIYLKGKVQKRVPNQVNEDQPTGSVELFATELKILNEADTPIFEIEKASEVNEDLRMQYRYLDLRSDRMKNNILKRHQIIALVRNYLGEKEFWEVETPNLTKGTPEGAREFIVPARLNEGKFYALPQSPQQFKQLLMVGGVERYFQIARCFRDEDTRGDRQAEFTQLDIEMSFVTKEAVMDLNEALLIDIVKTLYPEKTIQESPFPRLKYADVIKQYGTDRPDLRKDKTDDNLLAFAWIIDFPFFEKTDENSINTKGAWTFTHNPFSAPITEHRDWLLKKENIGEIISSQYDIVLNGSEIGGGSIRSHRAEDLQKVFEIMGHDEANIQDEFGHMLEAFKQGCPPHGGIAWGLDRLVMILQGESSIRDVIAFPKTGDGRDLLMNAPSIASDKQLSDLGIQLKK